MREDEKAYEELINTLKLKKRISQLEYLRNKLEEEEALEEAEKSENEESEAEEAEK
jgi:hypothetical protein